MAGGDTPTPADILAFWREAGSERWYRKDDGFDAEVRRRYLELWQKASAGEIVRVGSKRRRRAGADHCARPVSPQYLSRRCTSVLK
jgi:uncharacterized protein (DUF924 family)